MPVDLGYDILNLGYDIMNLNYDIIDKAKRICGRRSR